MGMAEDLAAAARKKAEDQLKATTGQSGIGAQLAGGLLNTLGIGGKKPGSAEPPARPASDVPARPSGAPLAMPNLATGIVNAITGAAGKVKDTVVGGVQAAGTAAAGLAITAASAALPEGTYLEDAGKGKPPVVVNVDRLQAEAEERIRIEREQAAGIYREGTGVGSNFVTVDTTAPSKPAAVTPAITAAVGSATPGAATFDLVTAEEHRADLAAQASAATPASTVSASASGIVAATPVATAFTEAATPAATATAAAKPSVTPGLDQAIQETQAVDPERAALLKRARGHVAKLGAPAP